MKKKVLFISAAILIVIFAVLILIPVISKYDQPGVIIRDNSKSYFYKNSVINSSVDIKSATYTEEKFVLKADFNFAHGDISTVTAYNSNHERIEESFDYKYSLDKLTLEGNKISEISGLEIHFEGNMEPYVRLRYLDSDQYAILVYHFADDAGYITLDDTNLFLTHDELDAIKAKQEAIEANNEEIFSKYEGEWYSEDNPDLYFNLYLDEKNNKRLEFTYYNSRRDKIEKNAIFVDFLEYDSYNSKEYVSFIEITHYETRYDFETFEDDENMIAYLDTVYIRSSKDS